MLDLSEIIEDYIENTGQKSRGSCMKDLKSITLDYLQNMEKINKQRVQLARRELEFCKKESKLFNDFSHQFYEFQVEDNLKVKEQVKTDAGVN